MSDSPVFFSAVVIFLCAFILRFVLLVYGIYQDNHSALKYTDIDYYVFTDAAKFLARGQSPYDRATYRYTPLLAWILIPTTWGALWFHFGKGLFALSDLAVGWLTMILLERKGMDRTKALQYSSVWLLNPMVANISTRGSSEGLLCVLVIALLWAFETGRTTLSGVLLGTSVHFKIYPFIYGASMLWALESPTPTTHGSSLFSRGLAFLNWRRLILLCTSLVTFALANTVMYIMYGSPFISHTFTYHLTRLDHRHNFSPYNTLLYLSSAEPASNPAGLSFASLAFIPQIILSCLLIPLSCAKLDLPATMLAQTLAFVSFNKVATSQYFLWYLVFLPLYLPHSYFQRNPNLGTAALGAWAAAQALWLWQGYRVEFLGISTFFPGLMIAGLFFFSVNCWLLGIVVSDIVRGDERGKRGGKQRTNRINKERILVMQPAEGTTATSGAGMDSGSDRQRKKLEREGPQ